jgi:energy-coupling factor transport system permease protein
VSGASWLHRMSPVPKLAWLVAVACTAFATYHPVPLLLVTGLGLGVGLRSGLARPLARSLLVVAPLAASIVVVQSTAPGICGPCTAAATVGPLAIHQEGLARALSLIARVLAMDVVAVVVFASTEPADLVAALVRLRVPFVLAFMLSMTLELVPVARREIGLVLAAQRARGMRGSGFGALIPSFVPVFAGTFERMQQLAISLESRGFVASGPRTSYRRIRFGARDRVVSAMAAVAGVAGVAAGLTAWGASQVPVVAVPGGLALAIVLGAAVVFVGVVLASVRAIARV